MRRRGRPARRAAYRRYDLVAFSPIRSAPPRTRELRQAAVHEINWPRVVSGAILLGVMVASIWIGSSDLFYIRAPQITGNVRVPEQAIVTASGMAGLHILWANARDAEAGLMRAAPQLESAQVTCELPANCSIAVRERQPLFAWRWGQAVVWIDRAGVAFPPQGEGPDLLTVESINVPTPAPGQSIDPKLMASIVTVATELPEVRQYRYTAERGLEFQDERGYPVYLGVGTNMSDRVVVWRALCDDLARREIAPAFVDVRFPLAPYYAR
jgi:hypothetical protein